MNQHRDPETARKAFYDHVAEREPAPARTRSSRVSWALALLAPALAGVLAVLVISNAAAPSVPTFQGSPFIHPEVKQLGLVAVHNPRGLR